jgi:hypothetical protein
MKKILLIIASIFGILALVYVFGPSFRSQKLSAKLPEIQVEITGFENYLEAKNSALKIKPDNESRIIWANDSLKSKTEYCLLYLHGFSASWYEGEPVHRDFARR